MTEHELMSANRDCGADAAPYVLGALDPDEAEAFRVHLNTCVVCRDEVSAFQEVADALPLAAPPQPVPRALKRRVMAGVRAEPRGSTAPRRWRALTLGRSPALVLSAVLAAVLIAAGAVALLSAAGTTTKVYSAQISWPGSAQVRVTGSHGELVVRGMPAPPQNKIYEVWILRRGAKSPSPTPALFSVTSSGSGSVDVPGNLRDVSTVMVTPEPPGGSLAPTHAPILQARIS